MNNDQVRRFCLAIGIKTKSTLRSKGWVQFGCPLAPWRHKTGKDSNPSFGIKINPQGTSTAHCFSCGFGGDLHDLILEMKALSKNDYTRYDFKKALQLIAQEEEGGGLDFAHASDIDSYTSKGLNYFSEAWLSTFQRADKNESALAYLRGRKVPLWLIKELDLRFDSDPNERRVCFPIRDFEGNLVGFHGRTISKKIVPPYRMYTDTYPIKGGKNNPSCWYGEDKIDLDKPIVLVESVFDYVRVYEFYKNVLCPLTAEVTKEKIERISDMTCGILMFDGDAAGRRGMLKILRGLPKVLFRTVYLPEGKDPGSMSKEKLFSLVSKNTKSNLFDK